MLEQVLYRQLTRLSSLGESGYVRLEKKAYPQEQAFPKLTAPAELTILHMTLSHPGIHLHEIQTELLELLGVDASHLFAGS